jgi:hypothetical protein
MKIRPAAKGVIQSAAKILREDFRGKVDRLPKQYRAAEQVFCIRFFDRRHLNSSTLLFPASRSAAAIGSAISTNAL